ncbi:hypothetical protein K1T35_47515 (plasmid) [Pseudonocardia sp. DSM 110487]|uniref:hypothetical protein n=1 Tax=Pseudonocardia sp. DSM 110487 TaxID=2865833 RepID=UPI001C6A4624|nr:hypothetical protein [Pseudonocardia sp. DSM 110487]QYN40999.1 hypothetical protein K1T35_47515 [Pseudonocardia sp. DSM 110487]
MLVTREQRNAEFEAEEQAAAESLLLIEVLAEAGSWDAITARRERCPHTASVGDLCSYCTAYVA